MILETVRNREVSVPKGSTAFWTDLLSNFWKISRLLGKIKNTVSLRFISLSFPRKKIILWRTCPYWQWIVCTMKKGNDRYLWSTGKNYNYFPKGKFKSFNSFFTKSALFFQYVWFLLPICLPCVVCGTYLTGSNAVPRDTSRGRHSGRVAWLVYLACLRSHVLCAYCNFESKQAISITLFGRHPNRVIE